jgi:glycerol-3-phosphate O-acyltransferase/dihydroxyacetone phosphate acyltransferase
MIYRFFIQIIKGALFFFFKKIVVSGKKNLLHNGPLIVVANHPNTFMDPFIIASLMKQQIGFLGNAGIFSNSFFARILSYFHVIPIFRKKDIKTGVKPDNNHSFSKCHEYLNKKGTILIFPEGNSYYELKLREIKTGTARIALSYQSLKSPDTNLKILPISLDYSDSIQFRSMVSVTISEPILLEAYKQTYSEDEIEGVLKLTNTIRQKLEKNIPTTSNKEQEQFLLKSHKFYTTFNEPKTDLHLNPKQSLASRAQISKSLKLLSENNFKLYADTEIKVHHFFDLLDDENLTPGFFTDIFLKKNKYTVFINYLVKFVLVAPIYLFGLISNYIPYILPSVIFKTLKLDIEYKTPTQMLAGLFIFPLFYWLEIKLIENFVNIDFWNSWLIIFIFITSGYIAMYYWTEVKRFVRVFHFYIFMKPNKKITIIKLRDDILTNIEIAKTNLNIVYKN